MKKEVRAVLDRDGLTYAQEAGIPLRDTPSPLYRLLVLSALLSARISSSLAVAAARELASEALRTARAMSDAPRDRVVAALGRAGYRRFDERTATMLADGAALVLERWGGDLRRLHAESAADVAALRRSLQSLPGIGPVGSAIFCREVQGVWPDIAPFVDERVKDGARVLGLPASASSLAALVPAAEMPRLAAACVRASLQSGHD